MSKMQMARVVVECVAPLAIGAGGTDDLIDAPVVVDADGLPTLPGTSLAGVLRAAAARTHEPEVVSGWFGDSAGEGQASRVWVSWGRPHDAKDQPVAPILLGGDHDDAVLDVLRSTIVRDRVRLNAHGAAADRGKFDQSFVPAGARFTLELRIDDDTLAMEEVLAWLHDASVGSSTRSGFGRLRVVRAVCDTFDLAVPEDHERFLDWKTALWAPPSGSSWSPEDRAVGRRAFRVELRPEQGLLIGGRGDDPAGADLTWFREIRIEWGAQGGKRVQRAVVPGTALKGALRHRTLFHLHVLCDATDEVVRAHTWLFGSDPEHTAELQAGRVRVGETVLPAGVAHHQQHVAIDRFTHGPRDGMLFDEESLWLVGRSFEVRVDVELDEPEPTPESDSGRALRALRRSIDDLCEGRLGLGHANSRGHGFFTGRMR